MTRSGVAGVVLALLVILHAPPARADIYDAARLVPDNVTLLVVIDDAAGLRASELGPPAEALAQALSDFVETSEAWGRLAARLDLSNAGAFDALLGRRALLASRTRADGSGEWALISRVTRATEDRLRLRLRPAPRAVVAGLPVLSVENGRFEMVVSRGDPESTLVIAPSSNPGLFDEIVASLAKGGPERSLGSTDPLRQIRVLAGQPSAMIFARPEADAPSWIAAAATSEKASIKLRFMARFPAPAPGPASIKPWSISSLDEIAKDAFALVVDWDALPQMLRPADILSDSGIVRELFGLGRMGPHNDRQHASPSGRSLVALLPSQSGVLDIVVALQSADVHALAPVGDQRIADLLAGFGVKDQTRQQARQDFGGAFPEAVRSIDLAGALGPLAVLGFDHGPTLAWTYRAGGIPEGGDASGWWTIGLGAPSVHRVSDVLARPDNPADRIPWFSRGLLRPSALLASFEARRLPLPDAAARVFSRVERVEWKAVLAPDGLIVGDGQIDLVPAPQKAVPPDRGLTRPTRVRTR